MRLPYHRELEEQRDFWRDRALKLEDSLIVLRAEHASELRDLQTVHREEMHTLRLESQAALDKARERELELFDKALKRHGSTTIQRPEPPLVPAPLPSTEELAYAEDWVAEYLEVFPADSIREAAEHYRAYVEGRYDPKLDQRLPINFTTDGRSTQTSN